MLHQREELLGGEGLFFSSIHFQFQLLSRGRRWVVGVSLLVYFQQILKDLFLPQGEVDGVSLGERDATLGVVDRLADVLHEFLALQLFAHVDSLFLRRLLGLVVALLIDALRGFDLHSAFLEHLRAVDQQLGPAQRRVLLQLQSL